MSLVPTRNTYEAGRMTHGCQSRISTQCYAIPSEEDAHLAGFLTGPRDETKEAVKGTERTSSLRHKRLELRLGSSVGGEQTGNNLSVELRCWGLQSAKVEASWMELKRPAKALGCFKRIGWKDEGGSTHEGRGWQHTQRTRVAAHRELVTHDQ